VLTGALILTGTSTARSRETSSPATNADTQEWNEIDVTLPLAKRLELTWVSLARLSSDIGGPVTYANGLYANVAIGDHLTVTPSYNQYEVFVYAKRQWLHTKEPGVDVTIAEDLQRCQLSDRSRFYRVLGGAIPLSVYRNRPRIDCHISSGPPGVTLFVADEFFHYSTFGGWTRNRFTSGTRIELSKRCALDLYYLRQVDERQIPGHINALGITLELRIGKLH
jgi:Protein of unknown function (DUF2490)